MQEALRQRVLAVGAFNPGAAESGKVVEVVEREVFAVQRAGEELVTSSRRGKLWSGRR